MFSLARSHPPKCITKIAPLQSPCSYGHGVQVHLQTCSITASQSISNLPDYSLEVHIIMASKYNSRLARFRLRGASRCSLDHGIEVYIQILSMIAAKCSSKLAQSLSQSVSLSSLDHALQVFLQMHSISASKCISNLARSRPWWVSLSSLDQQFLVHLELLSSTACSQSRYTLCRWVAI